jgi:GntR family transcriptional regulator
MPDRSTGQPPLHAQVLGLIQAEISSGAWPGGHKLPTEHELSRRFTVSRATIRHALADLQRQGLIKTRRGHGSFVADGERHRAWHLMSTGGFLDDHVLEPGIVVLSRVLREEVCPLPPWACGALEIPIGSLGVTLERLRWVDGNLVLYGINYLPAAFADHILGAGLERESLFQRLETRADIHLAGTRRTIEAVVATAELAELLGVQRGHPLALVESVSWDRDDYPIECHRSWVRTDRMRLEVELGMDRGYRHALPPE